ncbi:MAG TPA: EAL domain-containing protein [Arenimonas sp.]|uniref:EAL domain-containing protein n=1 Tax=Arenimonas sp. TaxID=1872635 RepID=UPI002D7F926E|nr:EAL domain-containing protein [Arenimonas sp.]HEU0153827.1 EAL domain-containing protein [Arenimonas sp.]
MGIHPSHRPEAGASLATLSVLLLVLLAVSALPLVEPGVSLVHYLPMHTALEMFAVAVSAMIFALGWSTQSLRPSRRTLWTGGLFLGVALFDLSHAMTLTGMPPYLGENTHDKTLYFWLFARSLAALAILLAVVLPDRGRPAMPRAGVLSLVLAVVVLGHALVLLRLDRLPVLLEVGRGLTTAKLGVEYALVLANVVAVVLLVLELRKPRLRNSAGLLGAAGASAMSGYFFASYGAINDGYALAGHVFKVVAYLFLYRALFVEAVRTPYAELATSRANLGATLDTLPDLLFEMDVDGNYLDVHANGEERLLAPAANLAGRNLREVMPAAAAEACLAALAEAGRTGRSVGTRIALEVPTGRRQFELSIARKQHADPGRASFLVLSRDVTELVETEAAIAHEARLNKALLAFPAQAASLDEAGYLAHGATVAGQLTGSPLALLYLVDEGAGTLQLAAQVAEGVAAPVAGDRAASFPLARAGDWADALRQHRPVVRTQAETPIDATGLPGELPALRHTLAVPVLEGRLCRMLLLVANKDGDYGARELESLQLVGDALWHVTSRLRQEHLLREKQEEMDYFFASDLDLYCIADARGEFVRVNPAWEQLLGYPSGRLAGRRLLDFVHPDDRDATLAALGALQAGQDRVEFANRYLSRDGTYRDIEWGARRRGEQAYLSARDVTERLRQESAIRRLSSAVSQSPSAIVITDTKGRIEYVNPAFTAISGYEAAEVLGKNPRFLKSGRTPAATYHALWAHLARGEPWQGEFINRRKDGVDYHEAAHIFPIRDVRGEVVGFMSHKEDVTARRAAAERIQQLSNFDQLTGLPNRSHFEQRFHEVLGAAGKSGGSAALLWLDLDNFKSVNDTLGHDVGDLLLREMANRLRTHLGDQDLASRQSGDDFTILLPGAGQDQAAALARQLLQDLQLPISLGREELIISGSIGIAMFPGDGGNVAALGACAEAAMYRMKQEGRNGYRFFAPAMQEHSARTLALTTALKQAIARGELRLVYQPQYSLGSGRLIGAEALLRWRSPQWGDVSPGEFVPLAEANGLIVAIGEWVLRTAAAQLREWQAQGLDGLTVAVNLAAAQFAQPGLLETVSNIAREAGIATSAIELELTEAVALRDPEGARVTMQALHEAGFLLSIDDFGTGYSSMSYLKRFPVDKLKIDQSFVRELSGRQDDQAIVSAIVQMAHSLGMATIAEGVETAEQLALLRARGCDEIQGYFYSRPLEPAAFVEFTRTRREPHPAGPG